MSHGAQGDPRCSATWPITGNPCKHKPITGSEMCEAHQGDGDQRETPPPDERRCRAMNKESGERCRQTIKPDATVCRVHGGKAKQVQRKATDRRQTRQARAMAATYGLPIDITPEQAILDEVHRTAGHVAWLERQVHALDADDLIWGLTRTKDGGDDRGDTYEAAPHAYLKLYQAERAHLARVSADAIRVGIEARQVKLAEQQGAMVAQAVRAILADLHLTAAQKALIPTVVPEHLRALALTN